VAESIRPRPEARELVRTSPLVASSGEGELGGTVLEAYRRRLAGAAIVLSIAIALYIVLFYTIWIDARTVLGDETSVMVLVASVACFWLVHRSPITRTRLVAVAVAFHAALAVAVTVGDAAGLIGAQGPVRMISWNCANILLVPALVPLRPRQLLVLCKLLAFTAPIALVVVPPLFDAERLSLSQILSVAFPQIVCAALAYVPASVIESLKREVARAKRLGAYDLVERLGEGAMGEVWRAEHRLLARPAAIKVVRAELLEKGGVLRDRALARFEREARVTAALESPHTVELYDFGVSEDGSLYYVMELLCGMDLGTMVDRFGPMPPERVAYLLEQICDSLEEAHRAGLVHRDIKPANVFVSRRADHYDWIKVLDFGLVKAQDLKREEKRDVRVTADGQIQGTPAFLAPEAATGEGPVDARADIYSLGCVAYYALTGMLVFDAKTPMKMAIAHVTEKPLPPSERLARPVPRALEEVVLACLAKSSSDRPASARELAERLAAIPFEKPWTRQRAAELWRAELPEHFHA
jgi:serine/threonine-protein kinase